MILTSSLTFSQGNIFLPDRTFMYAVEYSTESLSVLDTIKITATGRPWKTDPQKQLELLINYDLESLDTSVFSGLPSIGWVNTDTTGVVDNESTCWFHPPRHNQYKMLELAPFPRVEYPLQVNKSYSRILFIGDGWGDISNTKVVWHYSITEKRRDNWRVTAQAIPNEKPEKMSQLEFTFSVTEGFIDLHYILFDGTTISMKKI